MGKDYRRQAKILLYDLEVSPSLGYYYGAYDVTPIKTIQQPLLLCFSWKWLGDRGKPQVVAMRDFRQSYDLDDGGIVQKLWELLDECEVAVAYNGKRFDDKMANTFFLRHNMKPPTPYKEYDPLQTAKRFFKFDNNKLDNLGKLLIGEGKTETTYADVWDAMLNGKNKKEILRATKLMKAYCQNDVILLEGIYEKLLPWAHNHPNVALHAGVDFICPRCGNDSDFSPKAYRKTGTQINAIQYRCKHCGAYVTRKLTKEEREELDVNGQLRAKYRNLTP